MSIFNAIKTAVIRASERSGRARVCQELLRMSDRQLEDFGFSRALLREGVQGWPWREEAEDVAVAKVPVMSSVPQSSPEVSVFKQAA